MVTVLGRSGRGTTQVEKLPRLNLATYWTLMTPLVLWNHHGHNTYYEFFYYYLPRLAIRIHQLYIVSYELMGCFILAVV